MCVRCVRLGVSVPAQVGSHFLCVCEFGAHVRVTPWLRVLCLVCTRQVDEIFHLACPASPPHYQYNPIKTIKCCTMGTINMLGLAKRCKVRWEAGQEGSSCVGRG